MPAIVIDGRTIEFSVEDDSIRVDGREIHFEILSRGEGRVVVRNGESVNEIYFLGDGSALRIYLRGRTKELEVLSDRELLLRRLGSAAPSHGTHTEIKAPMPGLVVKTLVKTGDAIKKGTKILILEAMKMENEIQSPVDAEVGEMLVRDGDIVEKGQAIIVLR